jgi:hypothetical protein
VTVRLEASVAQTTTSAGWSNSRERVGRATLTMEKSIVAI